MKYRPEIDGLRALAVIPVILFHAGFEYFSGGFVGVDVFFVISGYLITTIILSEKEQGTFSLLHFYERRARRILPALFLVMLISLPFAWVWLLPSDMKGFSQSLVAVSTFSSNIYFWQEAGYWDVESELKPLLHTWSLAVEEQYYLLFPLFLMAMWRFRKRWILGSFMVVATVSLLVSQWGAYNHPSATFFLLPTRGWELAIGASIAFYFLYRKQTIYALLSHKLIGEALSLVGLLMIGYAVFAFDETVPFPSFYALLPTIGTGLIILFSSPHTLVGRLLGTKLLVKIGLISYSAYLWHFPIFAFARLRSFTEPNELLIVALTALPFPLAFLSWKYVEKPLRRRGGVSKRKIYFLAVIGSISFITIGLAGHLTDGFKSRFPKSGLIQQLNADNFKYNPGLSETCHASFPLSPDCKTNAEPEILIWGDSYAMHLVQGILASNPDAKIIQMTKGACGPFFDIAPVIPPKYPVSWAKDCLKFTNNVREWLMKNNTVKYAVVSSPFSTYLSKEYDLYFRNKGLTETDSNLVTDEFLNTLGELEAMGITPVVVAPPPANGNNIGRCLAQASRHGWSLDRCNFQVDEITQERVDVYNFLRGIQEQYRVIRLDQFICDRSLCRTHFGNTFIYRDDGHLSRKGSAKLGKLNGFYQLIVAGGSDR